jgi:hypothetical protein
MSYFLKSGNKFRVSSKEAMDLYEMLPAGNYTVKYDDMSGQFYLESIENFEVKGKRYGDLNRNTDRILGTFMDRPSGTGVMLTGEKGSGKSLLAKNLAVEAARCYDIPCIVINSSWHGDKFNTFIQSIEQPTIILFDEFEKVYDEEEQESMLTLLDGVFPSKKLFVLTCNDKWRVDRHMRNRPGRIFYMIDYRGLDINFIIEYCEDNLNDKTHIEKICSISSLFGQFNFDMLKALIEEMNRYNETPQEAMRMLNAKPEFDDGNTYQVTVQLNGETLKREDLEVHEWVGNPLQSEVRIDYKEYETPNGDSDISGDWDWRRLKFNHADLKKIDPQTGKFVFIKDGAVLTLNKVKEKNFHYYDAF